MEEDKQQKAIIDRDTAGDPLWLRTLVNLVNSIGVFAWFFITLFLLFHFSNDASLVTFRNALLNIVVPSVAFGILSLVAGLTLVSWLFPYFSYRKLVVEGTAVERAAVCIFWGLIAIALSLVISAGIR